MPSFEEAIRIHVQSLHISGALQLRDDGIESQLKRIEESINIMRQYEMIDDYNEIVERVQMLQQINDAFELATVEFTRFENVGKLIDNAIVGEIQDLFNEYPFLQYSVSLMRTIELGMN